jgi:malonate-semialdehyde dehydrogenase (acetylating)/methylmalonate-semialdehyde dehydrogenase
LDLWGSRQLGYSFTCVLGSHALAISEETAIQSPAKSDSKIKILSGGTADSERGFFVKPTLLLADDPKAKTMSEEIFGPVLQIARAEDFESAIALPNAHQYGNGTAIYTRNGRAAREFASRVEVGMVGINVPIPVPLAYHSFGGWKRSAFGDANQHGSEGVRFFTKVKTVTARWPEGAGAAEFVIPTMK